MFGQSAVVLSPGTARRSAICLLIIVVGRHDDTEARATGEPGAHQHFWSRTLIGHLKRLFSKLARVSFAM